QAPIPSVRAVRSDVPEVVDDIFQQMVAKRPEDRYQSMAEVIAALEQALDVGSAVRTTGGTGGGPQTMRKAHPSGEQPAGSSVQTAARPTVSAAEDTITQRLDNTNPGMAEAGAAEPGTIAAGARPGSWQQIRRPLWWTIAAGVAVAGLAIAVWQLIP